MIIQLTYFLSQSMVRDFASLGLKLLLEEIFEKVFHNWRRLWGHPSALEEMPCRQVRIERKADTRGEIKKIGDCAEIKLC